MGGAGALSILYLYFIIMLPVLSQLRRTMAQHMSIQACYLFICRSSSAVSVGLEEN